MENEEDFEENFDDDKSLLFYNLSDEPGDPPEDEPVVEPEMSELDRLKLEMKYSPKDLFLAKEFAKDKGFTIKQALKDTNIKRLIETGRKITFFQLK